MVFGTLSREDRTWGMICHLSALAGVPSIGVGFLVGPLVVWLLKRESSAFVADQAREALNFQICMMIYFAVSGVLCLLLIGFVLLFRGAVYDVVIVVKAAKSANRGERYRYPMTVRFVR